MVSPTVNSPGSSFLVCHKSHSMFHPGVFIEELVVGVGALYRLRDILRVGQCDGWIPLVVSDRGDNWTVDPTHSLYPKREGRCS